METIQTMVTDHLQKRGFHFNINAENLLFEFNISGDNGNWKVFIVPDEDRRFIQIISTCPIRTALQQMQPMCELINRINDSILFGKFSMDFEDGEVTYKTAGIYVDSELSDHCMYHLLQSNFSIFDDYLPAIIAVIYRHKQPLLAFLEAKQIEPSLN